MQEISETLNLNQRRTNWTALQYFNIYRILLSGLFVTLIHIGQLPQPLGVLDSRIFSLVSHVYLGIAIIFSLFIHYQFPRLYLQIAIQTLIDIIMLSLMMYSSNGLSSGFGMLLVIAVAGGSILRAGKISILFAAIATIAVLSHELYVQFFLLFHNVNYIHAGILGATFFVTAIIGNLLSARVKETEALAELQAKEINELAELNEQIVQRMQSGILVLNSRMSPMLINESAKKILLQKGENTGDLNEIINLVLKDHIKDWLHSQGNKNIIVKFANSETEVQASFIKLGFGDDYQILIFLEDIAKLRQRAQQLKLASLGRLAASIAHEVRNPLGAINHAGQLLTESDNLGAEDKRLTQIINEHSLRVNTIIENVLSISRREKPSVEVFNLIPWLQGFISDFATRLEIPLSSIQMSNEINDITVRIDPSQLHQALWNLCENALRYSKKEPCITLFAAINDETKRAFLDIIDYGTGMTDKVKEQLFEPFVTTETKGSGLGLYLAKELCEANQANLNLISSSETGTKFRISFMHINKQDELS